VGQLLARAAACQCASATSTGSVALTMAMGAQPLLYLQVDERGVYKLTRAARPQCMSQHTQVKMAERSDKQGAPSIISHPVKPPCMQ
jgi:hypothetical protein